MKGKLIIIFSLVWSLQLTAQSLRNDWIDYSKTYYKFKLGSTGLYRINQATLSAIGLSSAQAQHFQLWRNGVQVPLFTSITTGVFGSNDFIEFWGEMNDGKPDRDLYRIPTNQVNDRLSLETDTASYFLTINTNTTQNLRYSFAANNVAGNTLPAETNFTHTVRLNFRDKINRGEAVNVGEDVYSSTYDVGEGFSTTDITNATGAYKKPFGNLFLFSGGGAASLSVGLAGNSGRNRNIRVNINSFTAINQTFSSYVNSVQTNSNIPLSTLNGTTDSVAISIVTTDNFDRVVSQFAELKYPRQFNFGGESNFTFQLEASGTGKFLQITNFNNASTVPVLYDITNNLYYLGDISLAGTVRFALPSSSITRTFVLASRANNNINTITSLQQRNFVNFGLAANQGDFLFISHPILINGGTAIQQYQTYRNSTIGGNFNSKIINVEELIDQFGYGIKKHPLAIRNFLRFANVNFAVKPKHVLIIGKAVSYDQYRFRENDPTVDQQDLVPTFGWPASDVLLASANNDPVPLFPIGRIAAINQQEILDYLEKVKEYDLQAANTTQTLANKLWMKQLVHVAGADDAGLDALLTFYLNTYKELAVDTLFGGTAALFNKTTGSSVSTVTQADMNRYFTQGINLLTYFGHSAASGLSYNLNEPNDYNNQGKYPTFLVNGCSAGNFFDFDMVRFSVKTSLAEKFVFAKQRGTIAFIASSHFGLTSYLDFYSTGFYKSLNGSGYNQSLGFVMKEANNYLIAQASLGDFFGRTHAEQNILHGDPAIKIYNHAKPDYVLEDPQVAVSPNFISVADNNFSFKAYLYNIGKAINDSVRVTISRTYPNGSTAVIYNQRIKGIRYMDSLALTIPIVAARDKGNNSLAIKVESDNAIDELSETNNTVIKNFVVFEDELKPIYPSNFSIINKQGIKLAASTANALGSPRQYILEVDTTDLFNSSFKVTRTVTSSGGLIEFDAGITFTDSTVYYWRVAPTATTPRWNNASFVYLASATRGGFNQSHFFQHTKSTLKNISADTLRRQFPFTINNNTLTLKNAVWPYGGNVDEPYSIAINGEINPAIKGICYRPSNLTFNVFNPSTLSAMFNSNFGQPGQYGSLSNAACLKDGRQFDFAFDISNSNSRKAAMDFMDNTIPNGHYVVVRSILMDDAVFSPTITYAPTWKTDENIYGAGNSMYHRLLQAGFANIDSFNRKRCFVFIYKKGDASFTPVAVFSNSEVDRIVYDIAVKATNNNGYILSPKLGPASKWYTLQWNGRRNDVADMVNLKLLGVKNDNSVDTLSTYTELQTNNDISTISALAYPYMQLMINVRDTVNLSAYQLRNWRLLADGLPDVAVAPGVKLNFKDTLEAGEPLNFSIAYKNSSEISFIDSLAARLQVTDKNNVVQPITVSKLKKLNAGDTTTISASINTQNLVGNNTLYVYVNESNNPAEQHQFNNFAFRNFFVKADDKNPVLDVTFDGVHILNGDIVSSKPAIRINLKDDSKFLAINDTSLVTLQLRFPNNQIRKYKYGTDTLRFVPSTLQGGDNVGVVEFNPILLQDGTYELLVTGKDRSNNNAGTVQYRISFTINNTPMVSNLFNYPNPFTSSTAFVFTLTGNKIPDLFRIQILTVTGKVVKEINKQELGPLHIGRNITEYKWDGKDMYGQDLANGVYLYRVISSNNGQALDKFTLTDVNGNTVDTDKYFKGGYGKMYLMR